MDLVIIINVIRLDELYTNYLKITQFSSSKDYKKIVSLGSTVFLIIPIKIDSWNWDTPR
mgnify:CR=1 FL=1